MVHFSPLKEFRTISDSRLTNSKILALCCQLETVLLNLIGFVANYLLIQERGSVLNRTHFS